MSRIGRSGLLYLVLAVPAAWAQTRDNPPVPALPANANPAAESIRVALVDSGVNYTLPKINQGLARDVRGELIGYDFWDMDARPFDAHPLSDGSVQRHGTRTASIVLKEAPFASLVAYRYPRPDMSRMAELVNHAASNGVRVIGLPLGGNRREAWREFEQAAGRHPDMLFVASAGNNGRNIDSTPVYPAALDLDNLLVVTSADDFAMPAQGVNWGRRHVDYMVPAELQRVTQFDGSEGMASGSSYAVPRVVALAARILRDDPLLTAPDIIASIRRQFANGAAPSQIGQGYLYDPQVDHAHSVDINTLALSITDSSRADQRPVLAPEFNAVLQVPLDVMVLDEAWNTAEVRKLLSEANQILSVCGFNFIAGSLRQIQVPEYLRDLETGAARTLFEAARLSGPARKTAVVFARDTRMGEPFDAEAFGQGNTRYRPWLKDSVWLTLALEDRALALAHELFHVLGNSGSHVRLPDNLMLDRTTGNNRSLTLEQCQQAREQSLRSGLASAS